MTPNPKYPEKLIPGGSFRCRYDADWTLIDANEGLYRFLGYTSKEFKQRFQNKMAAVIHPEDLAVMHPLIARQLEQGTTIVNENRLICKDGAARWIWISAELMLDQEKEPLFYCIFIDITGWKEEQKNLAQREQRYDYVLSQTQDVIFEWDYQTREIYHSPNFKSRFGYDAPAEDFPHSMVDAGLIYPGDVKAFFELYGRYAQGARNVNGEFRVRQADGAYVWCRSRSSGVCDCQGRLLKVLGILYDIDRDKRELNQITEQARRDPLTGLYNKEVTEELIKAYLERGQEPALFMVIDVDNFKNVNDTLGHIYGDAVLSDISRRLNSLFRSSDVVGRVGGDEFVVFLPGIREEKDIMLRIRNAADVFHRNYSDGAASYRLSGSIGAACFPEDGATFPELFENADKAMYYAKNRGKNQYAMYSWISGRTKEPETAGEEFLPPEGQGAAAFFPEVPAEKATFNEGPEESVCVLGKTAPGQKNKQENSSRQPHREEEQLMIALASAGISLWEYDIRKKQLKGKRNFSRFHQLPDYLLNVPESLIESGYIHSDSVGEVRRLHQRLAEGEETVTADIRYNNGPEGRSWWERITYTVLPDETGRPARAVAAGENITRQKEEERGCHQEIRVWRESMRDIIVSGKINLTRNRVEYIQSGRLKNDYTGISYDKIFGIALETLPDQEERERFAAVFSREALLKSWLDGEKSVSLKHGFKSSHSKLFWVKTTMHLVSEPGSGELCVYGFIQEIYHWESPEPTAGKAAPQRLPEKDPAPGKAAES
ncbi:MAG: diguanylate cyclase [Peptococcaceae bacterium]|nr:diguanylate cyclase [Peptococcaceae bacterium]